MVEGRVRCASQEGNALFVASRMGHAQVASVLARKLVACQWPDGDRGRELLRQRSRTTLSYVRCARSVAPTWSTLRASFDHTVDAVGRATGQQLGKRQIEDLAARARAAGQGREAQP